jgi:hypothetical protein
MNAQFKLQVFQQPPSWQGRYRKIPGSEPAFHATVDDGVFVRWTDHDLDERLEARILSSETARALGRAVNDTKEEHTGSRGGSFLINEFGQVICPAGPGRYWVGTIKGVPQFSHPVDNGRFTLHPGETMTCNELWNLPYIGMAYNLSANDQIYFKQQTPDGEENEYLPDDYPELVRSLRKVRPFGAARFIVNLHGVVITKVEYADGNWRPHFVGMLDYAQWFPEDS